MALAKLVELHGIKPWSRLSDHTGWKADQESILAANQAYAGLFLVLSGHNRVLEEDPEAPFVTNFIWAVSRAAALKCLLKTEFKPNVTTVPPDALLMGAASPTYGNILRAAAETGIAEPTEQAAYKLPENYFVHRTISVGSRVFYFASLLHNDDETPYAVKDRL